MSLLRTEHLTKAFGSLVVTNDVTFSMEAGERRALIGPNGAGKTSFVNQIAGQLAPTSGRILLNEREITGLPPERIARAGVARTFQKNTLFGSLSVRENVRLAAQAKHGNPYDPWSSTHRDRRLWERADACLEMVRLTEGLERRVSSISYGERRQLEIAVALAGEPELLLLDEPTSGMSPVETQRLVPLIAELPRTLGLLIIEHDMDVVFSLADRITVLAFGEIVATGTRDEISANPQVRELYLGTKDVVTSS